MLKHQPWITSVFISSVRRHWRVYITNLVRLLAGTDLLFMSMTVTSLNQKNLKRQQFGQSDVKENKAEALIQTANGAYRRTPD